MFARLALSLLCVLTIHAALGDSDGSDGPTPWSHFVQGHCWIDDDPQFDPGQFDGGILYGRTSLSLREECAYIARERYGELGSSGLRNVRLAS